MSSYTDLFVVPVPKKKIEAFRRSAEEFLAIWRDNGALSCVEVEADDVAVGKLTSFPRSVDLKPDETVFVGIVTYRSREHRDEVNEKAKKDPRMSGMDPKSMPFDTTRMYFGGFKHFVGSAAPATGIQPYLFFRGRCEEAISFYRSALGAEVVMMMRFKDAPEKPEPGVMPPGMDDKVMHAAIRIAGTELMLSDGIRSGPLDFDCMAVSLAVPTADEAQRLFNGLAKSGTVEMPMCKTFFSPCFGSVKDKFGVSWMVIVPQPMPGA